MAYSYYRSVTIDHTKVPNTDQTNFPVLISGTYSWLATVAHGGKLANANGWDVIFATDAAGTSPIPYERESQNTTTGAVNFWVQVPSVSHTSDTVFYILYGNAAISTDQSNAAAVWDSNYKGVWHLEDGTTLSGSDSTSNGNNGSLANSPAAAAGLIGGGADFSPANSKVQKSGSAGLPTGAGASFTIQGWHKSASYVSLAHLFGFGSDPGDTSGPGSKRALLEFDNDYYFWGDSADWDTGIGFDSDSAWHQWAFTFDGTTLAFYRDGAQRATRSGMPSGIATTGTFLTAGSHHPSGSNPASIEDELRVSATARAGDWITAEYNNQGSPSTFYSVGSEVGAGGGFDPATLPQPGETDARYAARRGFQMDDMDVSMAPPILPPFVDQQHYAGGRDDSEE